MAGVCSTALVTIYRSQGSVLEASRDAVIQFFLSPDWLKHSKKAYINGPKWVFHFARAAGWNISIDVANKRLVGTKSV